MPLKTVVTGGVRSGKSRCAEALLARADRVTYVAPGPAWAEDQQWRARVAQHRSRRPGHWQTWEDTDLAGVLARLETPALIDCLGTWLTAHLDDLQVWDGGTSWTAALESRIDALVTAWTASEQRLVVVTNEVGMGLVSPHRSGRIFADWLGWVNQRIAAVSDEVILVVAGRHLRL